MTSLADMFILIFLQLYCASTRTFSPEGRGRVGDCIRRIRDAFKKKVLLLADMII